MMFKLTKVLRQMQRSHSGGKKKAELVITTQGDLLYGLHPVRLALAARRRTVHAIFYNEASQRAAQVARLAAQQLNIPTQQLSRYELDGLTRQVLRIKDHHVHQGLVADVSRMYHTPVDYKMPQVAANHYDYDQHLAKERFVLLVYGIRDPVNLGALLRSAHFFGIKTVLVAGDRIELSAVVSKASSGAMELINLLALRNPAVFIKRLVQREWNVIALSLPRGSLQNCCTDVSQAVIGPNNLIVIGSENVGIPEEILELAQQGVYLQPSNTSPYLQQDDASQDFASTMSTPTFVADSCLHDDNPNNSTAQFVDSSLIKGSWVDSLNVSVATGILLHGLTSRAPT